MTDMERIILVSVVPRLSLEDLLELKEAVEARIRLLHPQKAKDPDRRQT